MLAQRLPVALEALTGEPAPAKPGDDADAPVPQPNEVAWGLVTSLISRPMTRLRPALSERAMKLTSYLRRSMARCTRSTVSGATKRVPLMTCDTVVAETPASRATSLSVTGAPSRPGVGSG